MRGEQRPRGTQTDVAEMSLTFAVDVVKAVGSLPRTTAGFELGRQLIRSGTSIGANVEEAQGAWTKREFGNLMNIAKREARETRYWLHILKATDLLKSSLVDPLVEDTERLIRILTAIVKTAESRRPIDGHPSPSIRHPASKPREEVRR